MYSDFTETAAALEGKGFRTSPETRALYASPRPVWFRNGAFDINHFRQLHTVARMHGLEDMLPPADYVRSLGARIVPPETRMEAELVMTEVTLRMARELLGLRELPGYAEIAGQRDLATLKNHRLGPEMLNSMRINKLSGWLDGLAPQSPDYRGMVRAYAQLKEREHIQFARAGMAYARREPEFPEDNIIIVNLATQELDARLQGREFTSAVVIGAPETPSPAFLRPLAAIYAQRDWHVPEAIQQMVGRKTIRTSPGNPMGAGTLTTRGPESSLLHGYAAGTEALFGAPVRAFSHGGIRIQAIRDLIAAALPYDAAARLGFISNSELAKALGQSGADNRWATPQLNNTRLSDGNGIVAAAIFRPFFVKGRDVMLNTSDPYGWGRAYSAPEAFTLLTVDASGPAHTAALSGRAATSASIIQGRA